MKYCPNCHCASSNDSIYCRNCGIQLNSEEESNSGEFNPTPSEIEEINTSDGYTINDSNEVYTSAITFLDNALKGLAVLSSFAGFIISCCITYELDSILAFLVGILITAVVVVLTMATDLAIVETMKNIISITENARALRKLYEQDLNQKEKAENDK